MGQENKAEKEAESSGHLSVGGLFHVWQRGKVSGERRRLLPSHEVFPSVELLTAHLKILGSIRDWLQGYAARKIENLTLKRGTVRNNARLETSNLAAHYRFCAVSCTGWKEMLHGNQRLVFRNHRLRKKMYDQGIM